MRIHRREPFRGAAVLVGGRPHAQLNGNLLDDLSGPGVLRSIPPSSTWARSS